MMTYELWVGFERCDEEMTLGDDDNESLKEETLMSEQAFDYEMGG